MDKIAYNKSALLAELKKVMDETEFKNSETDISSKDIMREFNVSYKEASDFLNRMVRLGILTKINMPGNKVVFRDIDGKAIERVGEYISKFKR